MLASRSSCSKTTQTGSAVGSATTARFTRACVSASGASADVVADAGAGNAATAPAASVAKASGSFPRRFLLPLARAVCAAAARIRIGRILIIPVSFRVLGWSRRNHARSAGTRTKQGNPYAPLRRPCSTSRQTRARAPRDPSAAEARGRMVLATEVRRVPRSIARHGFSVYTEQEQVAFLRRAGFSDVRFGRRKGPFVFALAAKARPSAASP